MSDRTLKQGDTYPSLKMQVTDENGLVDLTGAEFLEIFIDTSGHLITGTPVPIVPAEADADGVHFWNLEYDWASGDTAIPEDYAVELKVTWSAGPPPQVQHFPNAGTASLTIEPSLG